MAELRKYNDETHLDEVLDIIKYKFIDSNLETRDVELLILWYIYDTKKSQTYYTETDKVGKTKVQRSSIYDLIEDYGCGVSKEDFKMFAEKLDSIYKNIEVFKTLSSENVEPFFLMTEDAFQHALTSLKIEKSDIALGFMYAGMIKSKAISIGTLNKIHPANSMCSIPTYAVVFYNILKMMDKNEFMDTEKFPTYVKEEKKEEPVKEEDPKVEEEKKEAEPYVKAYVVPKPSKYDVKTNDNGAVIAVKQYNPKVQPTSTGIKIPEEVKSTVSKNQPIQYLEPDRKWKERFCIIKDKKNYDLLTLYNGINLGTTSVAAEAKKIKCNAQSVYNHLYVFCDTNNLPRPRQDYLKEEISKYVTPEPKKKEDVDFLENDPLFQKAQIQNAREINKISNSKVFFPSQIEGLKEEITGQTKQVRRFINKPITKGKKNKDLILTKEQKRTLITKGEGWLVLNDGCPYFVTTDQKIWRNKPTEQDILEAR